MPKSLNIALNAERVKYAMERTGGFMAVTYDYLWFSNLCLTPFVYLIGPPDALMNMVFRWILIRKGGNTD